VESLRKDSLEKKGTTGREELLESPHAGGGSGSE